MKVQAVTLLLVTVVLAGCSGSDGPAEVQEDEVPDEIGQDRVSDLEKEVGEKFPRRFAFAGQEALESVRTYINDTVSAGTGSASPEVPNDNGVIDGNPTIVRHDVSEHVPVGQPVEIRIKLKWWGNPGSSADLDIFADVPGTTGAYDPDSFDESINWNIVTKFAVLNTVHVEGAPFDVGVQVSNGKVVVEEMPYSLQLDFEYGANVLAPGIAYGITVPANASRLVFESEPLGGDEHIRGDFVVIDPADRMLKHIDYNDIGVDARVITVRSAGEYVIYSPFLRGGFLKVSTDVSNEAFQARILPMEEKSDTLASAVLPPVGEAGTFAAEGFPLEMHAWLAPTSAAPTGFAGQAALNITSPDGWVTTTVVTGRAGGDDVGRIGNRIDYMFDNTNLAGGDHGWTVEGSAAVAMDAGYRYLTYSR